MTIAVNRNLSNCENSPKKRIFGASTGFEPVASALALQCSHMISVGESRPEAHSGRARLLDAKTRLKMDVVQTRQRLELKMFINNLKREINHRD